MVLVVALRKPVIVGVVKNGAIDFSLVKDPGVVVRKHIAQADLT